MYPKRTIIYNKAIIKTKTFNLRDTISNTYTMKTQNYRWISLEIFEQKKFF